MRRDRRERPRRGGREQDNGSPGRRHGAARLAARFAALLSIRERVQGPEHPDTLIARANLAHTTGAAGDQGLARDQYAALLPIYERLAGAEHPDALSVRNQLAYWSEMTNDD